MNNHFSRRRFLQISTSITAFSSVGIVVEAAEAQTATAAAHAQSNLTVSNLRINYLTNPLGIDHMQPRLSWVLTSAQQNQVQSAYQIQIASSPSLLNANTPDLWDSGPITASASTNIPYGGPTLQSRQIVYWQVRAWDKDGNASTWSTVASWEMGLLSPQDWSASWISNANTTGALPLFAKQFNLPSAISSARLYITGLGIYEASINGTRVSNAVLQPLETNYLKRVIYTTCDVTTLLQQGANAIGVQLGNGIAYITSNARYTKFTGNMCTPRLFAQLEVTLSDGTTTRIVSDSSWLTTLGPTTFSNWFGGEDYDARLAPQGWQQPGANLSSWQQATVTSAPSAQTVLSAQMMPSVQPVKTVQTIKITQPATGKYVFDLGVNFAGWQQLQISGPAGTTITMSPGELLLSDGTVSQVTTGSPIYDNYTLSGNGTEVWHPTFMYHGFRYLQVTGLPSVPTTSTFSGIELSTANTVVGTFTSSNPLLNAIYQIINQAIQNNMFSVLTDCPHREKLGWLEEAHLVFESICRRYDVAAYYRQLLRNISDTQIASGLVPDISPEYVVFGGGFRDDPNWGSTLIMSSLQVYQTYGDTDVLNLYYTNMQNYMSYLQSKASGNLLNYGLGEWGAVDTSTPVGVTASYAYYKDAQAMSRIAAALGKAGDAAAYATLTQQIGDAFNAKYLNTAQNTYSSGSHACDALALDMGIVPTQYYQGVLQHLVTSIQAHNYHLTVGEIALPSVFRALAQGGYDNIIYLVATSTTFPSYGYLVNSGATALSEYWDGASGTGSQDHFMLGAINSWFNTNVAGLRAAPDTIAYNKLVICPSIVGNLTSAASTYTTPYGLASSSWALAGSVLTLQVQIPVNTTATVMLPVNQVHPVATMDQGFQGFQNGYAVYAVGSGNYSFTSNLAGKNIAQGKTVTSNNSLENSDWGVACLTDGVLASIAGAKGYTSNIFSSSDASSNAPYVDIDLGSNQAISQVQLFPRTDAASTSGGSANFPVNFTIQVAPDGGSYTTVKTVTNQADPAGLAQTYGFTTTSARHVRLVATTLGVPANGESGANFYRLQLAEFIVQ